MCILTNRIKHLETEIMRVKALYDKTLKYQGTDPEVSLFQARKSAEAICKAVYIKEDLHKQGKPVSKLMLNEMIQSLERNGKLPKHILINLGTIQAFGNFGSHDQGEDNDVITVDYIQPCLLALGTVFNWYVQDYHIEEDSILLSNKENLIIREPDVQHKLPLLKVVGNHAPPYRIFRNKDVSGIYFEMMKEIEKRLNLKIEYINQPFKTALLMMKTGEADIMVGPNKTAERTRFMDYSEAKFPAERKAFFVHFSSKPIFTYEELYERVLIVSRGKVYTDKIDTDPNLKKVTIRDYKQGFQLLQNNADYVMIMPEKEGEYLIDESGYDVLSSPFYLEGRDSYLAFSGNSQHQDIFKAIEKVVDELKEDGTYEEIIYYY